MIMIMIMIVTVWFGNVADDVCVESPRQNSIHNKKALWKGRRFRSDFQNASHCSNGLYLMHIFPTFTGGDRQTRAYRWRWVEYI
jgi:hypothetical protein